MQDGGIYLHELLLPYQIFVIPEYIMKRSV